MDWSSDVCSSDLASISTFDELQLFNRDRPAVAEDQARRGECGGDHAAACLAERMRADGKGNLATIFDRAASTFGRSKERRVGKECVSTSSYRLSQDP